MLVWPDLVYTEMICMIALSALLIFWAIWLQAPLEEPASSVKTPNPSKAPWYFLGLQEMLVYYDPWMAGVVLPSLIIVGLMAIPYIDFNKDGNGYYTIKERKFAYIIVSARLSGAVGDADRAGDAAARSELELLRPLRSLGRRTRSKRSNNINLSEYFWQSWLGTSLPKAPPGSGAADGTGLHPASANCRASCWCWATSSRCRRCWRSRCSASFYQRMGFIRYMVLTNLLLFMMALPIKMVLRWSFNLKYMIAIPEYFLNF